MNVRSSDAKTKTAAALGIDGRGVKVAYIADGINPKNKAFIRSNGKSAIVDYKDFYGDGPDAPTGGAEAFGDASAMVAQGNVVYDVAAFANPKVVSFPGGHCYIRIVGVAPGASLVALKAGSELLPNSAILQSIDYAVRVQHVDVLNESFGSNVFPDSSAKNTIQLFNDQAVRAGVTVTVSTGDAGVTSTIGRPVHGSERHLDGRFHRRPDLRADGLRPRDAVRERQVAGQQHLVAVLRWHHAGRPDDRRIGSGRGGLGACDSSTTTVDGQSCRGSATARTSAVACPTSSRSAARASPPP